MPRTEFIATGFHVPARVVTNDDLARLMDTSDEWIMQRSGIKTRYWVSDGETGVTLAREAACKALTKAGLQPRDLDCIVYCTCTPDHFEPGNGVFLQRELGISDIPAIDVRNQCSGFCTASPWPTPGSAPAPTGASSWSAPRCTRAGSTRRPAAGTRRFCSATAPARWCSAPPRTRGVASSPCISSPTAVMRKSCGSTAPVWRTTPT